MNEGRGRISIPARKIVVVAGLVLLLVAALVAGSTVRAQAQGEAVDPGLDEALALREAEALQSLAAEEAGRSTDSFSRRRFTGEQNVFVRSTLAVNDLEDVDEANATFPLYKGVGPDGDDVDYIVTEASNFDVARRLGINYAPKLAFGRGSGGDQKVTLEEGRLNFKGAVDFGPERVLEKGDGPSAFPPSVAEPGAVADDQWSSLVVLPSGSVLNVAAVANDTGRHDRVISLDDAGRTVTMELLDGFQGGDQRYYHLVTDSSDPVAATIELGVYAPRLANLPAFGESDVEDESALLAFSPNANGETGLNNPERQGLNSTIVDNDLDPINVFPLDPDNDKPYSNNYSPMWDAHVSMWTDEAIEAGERRRITGFEDLQSLVEAGSVTSFEGSPGEENDYVAGLRATDIIINCPVIAQPFEGQDEATIAAMPDTGGPAILLPLGMLLLGASLLVGLKVIRS